ncbi:MAG TPA: DegT/DnrJ/EryC1/StrS family aminotransferase [Candidatus Dormibacteraeota bacterium]|nr:DegT/DnrJ/EryC1/StrS family aminotransferase [Candidatus Dormibacteraeota bacterium]
MQVPFLNLKDQYSSLRTELLEAIDRLSQQASFTLGEEVERFEREFAEFSGVPFAVAVNSGTSALHLALLAAGVGPGDEVITTANTFVATIETILYTGARPVFADIDPRTANLDPEKTAAAITARTRAIIPVHLYGRPAAMAAFSSLAQSRSLALVEDACQAHGAMYRGKPVGSFSLASAFSFYPTKNLGAYGEAGALLTADPAVNELVRSLRNHGQGGRYLYDHVGYNYRMEAFQAAVLRVKLRRLRQWTEHRLQIARIYRERLADARLEMPDDDPGSRCVYHAFAVYLDRRDEVREKLGAKGIETAIYYPRPLHFHEPYAGLGFGQGSLPATERACERVLCLPISPELSFEQAEYVAESLVEIAGRN